MRQSAGPRVGARDGDGNDVAASARYQHQLEEVRAPRPALPPPLPPGAFAGGAAVVCTRGCKSHGGTQSYLCGAACQGRQTRTVA